MFFFFYLFSLFLEFKTNYKYLTRGLDFIVSPRYNQIFGRIFFGDHQSFFRLSRFIYQYMYVSYPFKTYQLV